MSTPATDLVGAARRTVEAAGEAYGSWGSPVIAGEGWGLADG